jgi:hypothetical protein
MTTMFSSDERARGWSVGELEPERKNAGLKGRVEHRVCGAVRLSHWLRRACAQAAAADVPRPAVQLESFPLQCWRFRMRAQLCNRDTCWDTVAPSGILTLP